jgi:hypothetical protein
MTEEQAQDLALRVIPRVLLKGINREGMKTINTTVDMVITYLYRRGYQVKSYLTGEDYEKQLQRDFPGDTKENSGGN